METRLSNMERKVDTLVKNQETLAQVMTRIEMQLSQQTNPTSERQKRTLPSQPFPNPRNPGQSNEAQGPNQCNLVHMLRSGKQVDNQISMPLDPAQNPLNLVPLHLHNTSKKPKLISQPNKCINL